MIRGPQLPQSNPNAHRSFDPKAAGAELVERLKAEEGGAWSEKEITKVLEVSADDLQDLRIRVQVVSWRDDDLRYQYPKWQFDEAGQLLPGLREILALFQSADQSRILSYFLSPRTQLDGKRPLDLLREGNLEVVLSHARSQAQENTW